MSKKKRINSLGNNSLVIIIVAAALVVGMIIGVLISSIWLGKKNLPVATSCQSYSKALADVNAKLVSSGYLGKGPVTSLSGEVSSINGQQVVFTAPLPSPILADSLKTRTALITDKTVIILKKAKTTEQEKADNLAGTALLEPLQKQLGALKKNISLCDFRATSSICAKDATELVDLSAQINKIYDGMGATTIYTGNAGDLQGRIAITAEASGDISDQPSFEAIKITLTETLPEQSSTPAASSN
jgi:hypothetical protein